MNTRARLALARFLHRLGRFISSLPLMVLRPDELMALGRQTYSKSAKFWGSDDTVNKGLHPMEKEVLEKLNLTGGKVLVLGLGGGREAIPLARMGFEVTGVDFIPEMVDLARKNALKHGVRIDARVGDFARLTPPPASFDLICLFDRMYSTIPTRTRRINMAKQMHAALRPGGWFACMFLWNPSLGFSPRVDRLRKIFAHLTRGNLSYERGDHLMGEVEFYHYFRQEAELAGEFSEAGFKLMRPFIIYEKEKRGVALLQKAAA